MSMIDVSNLTFGYEGSPELIFDHVGFQIDSGWKLGFTGRNPLPAAAPGGVPVQRHHLRLCGI